MCRSTTSLSQIFTLNNALGLLGLDVELAHGIPLSVTGKSLYFDRK
jgi:uncharacterized ferredoxin-like protein